MFHTFWTGLQITEMRKNICICICICIFIFGIVFHAFAIVLAKFYDTLYMVNYEGAGSPFAWTNKWYDMIWYDIWYDMIWYVMGCDVTWYIYDICCDIWCMIYDMIYDMILYNMIYLTAVG